MVSFKPRSSSYTNYILTKKIDFSSRLMIKKKTKQKHFRFSAFLINSIVHSLEKSGL